MDYRYGSHTVYRIEYHFVWVTKYRYKVLTGDAGQRVRELVRQTCEAFEIRIIKGVVSKDHVHILVSAPPELAPSEIMRRIKGRTASKLFEEFPVKWTPAVLPTGWRIPGNIRRTLISTDHDLRQAYDALAALYDANRGLFDMQPVLDDFFAQLPAGSGALLDLGCGAGEPVAKRFVERGWEVTGVDFSASMLALAARYVPAMQTVHADMREVSFASGRFDVVTAIYSLFHLPYADHPALFARIRDWLRPGGRLLFTYATSDYTGAERFDGWKAFLGQRLYYSHTTPEALRDQLEAARLRPETLTLRDIGGERFLWVIATRD